LDGADGTELIFGAFIEGGRLRIKKSGAQFTVAAHGKGVYAFDGGVFQDAMSGAVAAGNAGVRIDLPNRLGSLGAAGQKPTSGAYPQQTRLSHGAPKQVTPAYFRFLWLVFHGLEYALILRHGAVNNPETTGSSYKVPYKNTFESLYWQVCAEIIWHLGLPGRAEKSSVQFGADTADGWARCLIIVLNLSS